MTVTITTSALQKKLVTLVDLKVALDISVSTYDTFLDSLIDRVSAHFDRHCRRTFARQIVTETFNGNGRTEIHMSHFPMVNLGALSLDAATIATTEYEIWDAAIASVFMENGWVENIPIAIGVTRLPLAQIGDNDYSLIYTSGFLLPSDNITAADSFTDCATNVAAGTFTRTSGKWPLLVDGDKITFGGFTASGLNTDYTVASRTDLVITVDETLTDTEAAGQTVTLICQTLPEDIEEGAIEAINTRFAGRNRDRALKSERIGDFQSTYGAAGLLTDYVTGILSPYKVIF